MAVTENTYILMCTNKDCGNDRIIVELLANNNGRLNRCDLCGKELSCITTSLPPSGGKLLIEKELSSRSELIDWLDMGELIHWPGPVAFEYKRFREIMADGNIEAACWKIANLAEVTVSYLFAAALEVFQDERNAREADSVSKKINYIRSKFADEDISQILNTLHNIMRWRNKFGVGHGSLVLNKETYIDSLLKLGSELNGVLKGFNAFLARQGLTLAKQDGSSLCGADYYFSMQEGGVKTRLIICPGTINNAAIPPVLAMSSHFAGVDVYFLDSIYKGVLRYRNFRRNENKHLDFNYQLCWDVDPGQVSWLSEAERQSWYMYFFSRTGRVSINAQLGEILVDAAEQFQSRGMSREAMWCLDLFEKYIPPGERDGDQLLRLNLVRYSLKAALGKEASAQSTLDTSRNMLVNIGDEAKRRMARVKVSLVESWYKGVYGDVNEALQIIQSALEDIQSLKELFPHSASLYDLELRKNYIYLSRRLSERDTQRLQAECLRVFQEACALYAGDPDNYKIVDIIGFACNLYGEYTLDLLGDHIQPGSPVMQEIFSLMEYGEKIRSRAYHKYPDDIWVMRGYAWCLHVRARIMRRLGNQQEALELLDEALEIRKRCEQKFPEDLGVKEDILKNLIEAVSLGLLSKEIKKQYILDIRMGLDSIRDKEGHSPRIRYLEGKIIRLIGPYPF
jgi:tetratricopeptide (TPR) repeat protein